jgi:hypothetical protein
MVVGREQEQAAFKKWMQSKQAEVAVIYGIINLCEAKFTNKEFTITKDKWVWINCFDFRPLSI